MRRYRISHRPTFDDQINPTPQWHVAVMRCRQMIEQLHPKARYRFVIDVHPVMLGEASQCFPHPCGGVIKRPLAQVC